MTQVIQHRRSDSPGKVPTTAQLALGELAVNTYDGRLFLKKDDGAESIVEIGGGQSGYIDVRTTYTNVTTGSLTELDFFLTDDYVSAKYIVSVTDLNTLRTQISEVAVAHNNILVTSLEYGFISTSTRVASFSAAIVGSSVKFYTQLVDSDLADVVVERRAMSAVSDISGLLGSLVRQRDGQYVLDRFDDPIGVR